MRSFALKSFSLKKVFFLFLFMSILVPVFSQEAEVATFDTSQYLIKTDTIAHLQLKIIHTRIKPKQYFYTEANCRSFLTVYKHDSLIHEIYSPTFAPSNGCAGYFTFAEQPIKGWYLIQRMGEGENAMLLIDSLGRKYEMNGAYFCFLKGFPVVISYDEGITRVFSLAQRKVVSVATCGDQLFEWYADGEVFFANYMLEKGDDLLPMYAVVYPGDGKLVSYNGSRPINRIQQLIPQLGRVATVDCYCK